MQKCILRKTMGEKNRSVSQQDSNTSKDTIHKNPRKWIGMFSGMWAIYIKILWSSENEVCLIWRKIVFQTASDWIESTYSKDRQFAFYDDSEQKIESLLRLFVVAWS